MKNRPRVTILVGESGSGKSTKARHLVDSDPEKKTVRINRDDIRSMLHLSTGSRLLEQQVIEAQRNMLRSFVTLGFNVVIDDTNLNENTVLKVSNLASSLGAVVELSRMRTTLHDCIVNDRGREGKARVGRAVIERQFLAGGNLNLGDKPIAIVDIDGTLANHEGIRSPYDESKVLEDRVYPDIHRLVEELYYGGICEVNPEGNRHTVLLVSGRHSTCGEDTVEWLWCNGIPFDHIFMRHGWDNRPDTIVKKEILDEILRNVPKEQISLVIDDRPSVLNMWHSNGLRIFPAREVTEPF